MNTRGSHSWRVIDIVTAAVLGVACGLIFWMWNSVGYAGFKAFDALTPGLGGLFTGIWFLGGTLGGLVIRKPGAAVFVEVLAASVSAVIGSQWGIETLYSGLAQGLGAEIVFLIFAYKKLSTTVAVLAGMGSAVGAFVLELFLSANFAMGLAFNVIYLSCMLVSGALLAGIVAKLLVDALAKTGALDRFGAGRERFQQEV
ncbi:ECF transporter S component [Corynebacterium sp. MC-17D]|uniref:ECF transporter S component n=1 Tax=Corynebacterium lipophilum TaxID=2804918 RepID=A0AAW5HRI4_9CORY|nr:ECF transporter S component [Corynebacterium lipophilum]MCO6394098.1 ECF transporter S component [Corynebacterium lipophilum]MCZ2116444.1 ECF transporter S component [Corynebacterium lipophilum]